MTRPVVFLDLDHTLVRTKLIPKDKALKEAQSAIDSHTRFRERLAAKGRVIADKTAEKVAYRDYLESAGVEIQPGREVWTTMPRPGLVELLEGLQEIAEVYLLSAGSVDYLEAVTDVFEVRQYFKGLLSVHEPEDIPDLTGRPWVLVDDLEWGTSGVQEKLRLLGDFHFARFLQVDRFEGIPNDPDHLRQLFPHPPPL
jgi:hypothetical protein